MAYRMTWEGKVSDPGGESHRIEWTGEVLRRPRLSNSCSALMYVRNYFGVNKGRLVN